MSTTRRDFISKAALLAAATAVVPSTVVKSLAGETKEGTPDQRQGTPVAEGTEGVFAAAAGAGGDRVAVGPVGGDDKEPDENSRMAYATRIMNKYNVPHVKGATGLETEDDIEKSRLENTLKLTDQISREGWYQFGAGVAAGVTADALLNKVKFDFRGKALANIITSTAIITGAERATNASSILAPSTQAKTLMDKYGLAEADATKFYEDHKKYSTINTASGALTGACAYEAKDAVHKGFKTVHKYLGILQNRFNPNEPGVH